MFPREPISLSYTPIDTAIVPPETPGIMLAIPITRPLIKSNKNFIIQSTSYILYIFIIFYPFTIIQSRKKEIHTKQLLVIYLTKEMRRVEKVSDYIAVRLRELVKTYENEKNITEIRMRSECPLIINTVKGEEIPMENGRVIMITQKDIKETLEYVSNYSLYAYEENIKNGYITMPGGNRVGVCGHVVFDGTGIKTIRNISFINIRVACQVIGCANKIMPYICRENKKIYHTIIVSAPGCGKTTLLRDVIRQLSVMGVTVGIADERSEIAACSFGIPQNDIGIRTDVLDGCPKALGMMMLIRAMNPDVIAVDEIGGEDDMNAVSYAINCGCSILATAHASDYEELTKKKMLKYFERVIILEGGTHGKIAKIYDGEGKSIRIC